MAATYYDLIRIYGLPAGKDEYFQGLGAAALYNAADAQPVSGGAAGATTTTTGGTTTGGTTTEQALTISAELWTAQSNLITQQSSYLSDIKATFTTKREELKVGFTMQQFSESGVFKYLADIAISKVTDWITDAYPGVADDAMLDTIAKYAPKAIGWALVWLDKQFLAGGLLCDRMIEENNQLLTMSNAYDYYKLRSDIVSQHDLTIQNLLSQVALVETQLQTGGADLTGLNDTLSGALYAKYDPKFGTTLGWKYNAGLTEHLNKALFLKDTEGANEDIGLATLLKELSEKIDNMNATIAAESVENVIQCPHTGDYIFSHSRGKMTKL